MAWKPITLGPYVLGARGLTVRRPSRRPFAMLSKHAQQRELAAAAATGEFLEHIDRLGPFWLGDWYNAIRAEFPEHYSQLLEPTGYVEDTLEEYGRVCRRIPISHRQLRSGVRFDKHQAVAALDPPTQARILKSADAQKLAEVRQDVRHIRRRDLGGTQAELAGQYRVIYAAPDYHRMTIDQIAAVPIATHARKHAALFLWTPEHLRFAVAAILEAWGFVHRRALIWDRQMHSGPDHYLSVRHESLIWAVRGRCAPDTRVPMQPSIVSVRAGVGDAKPERFREIIERLYNRGPYLEVFAARQAKGWTCYGDEIGKAVA